MRLLTAVVLGVAVLTSGCGIMKPKTPAELMFQRVDAERRQSAQDARALQKKYILSAPRPVCDSDADCKAKWQAAQLWVVNNANYKCPVGTHSDSPPPVGSTMSASRPASTACTARICDGRKSG